MHANKHRFCNAPRSDFGSVAIWFNLSIQPESVSIWVHLSNNCLVLAHRTLTHFGEIAKLMFSRAISSVG